MSATTLRSRRLGRCAALWVVPGALGSWALAQPLPQSIQRIVDDRRAIETAWIEFTYQDQRHQATRAPVSYTARLAGSDTIGVNHGSSAGIVMGDPRRQGRPRSVLKTASETWGYDHDGLFVALSGVGPGAAEGHFTPRTFGVAFGVPYQEPDNFWQGIQGAGVRQWREARDGELQRVTIDTEKGTITWWLDPARGGQPVRSALTDTTKTIWESVSTLAEFDGVWYPTRIETYTHDYQEGREPVIVIEVLHAEFNRPEHPRRFRPADIGVEPGMIVERLPPVFGGEIEMWDGERPVPASEFGERMVAGELERGPTNAAALESLPDEPDPAYEQRVTAPRPEVAVRPHDVSAWEAYTRAFIVRHRLDAEQSRKAWRVLTDCQRDPRRYLDGQRERITRLESDLARLRSSGAAERRISEAAARLKQLQEPIERIFRERLRPGLESLLTREQRDAAERDTQGSAGR